MSWLSSLFSRQGNSAAARGAADADEGTPAIETLTGDVAQVLEGLQKMARTQARQGVRLEEVERKLEGGFSDLRTLSQQAAQRTPASIHWDDLLDAADALDEAERTARAGGDAAMAEGLRAVGARIGRFMGQLGVQRKAELGAAPDPALVRVVGSVDVATVDRGHVARVVRAAVTERGRLLREGEVLVARAPSPSHALEQETP